MSKKETQEKWNVNTTPAKTPEDWIEDRITTKPIVRTKRLSVEIPIEMHKTLKRVAVDKELKMNVLVIESLKKFLGEFC